MTDRAKVIQGIHRHCEGSLFDRCDKCPYYEMDFKPWDESKFKCRDELLSDVSDLLTEQEAVKPVITPWAVNEDGEVEIAKRECGKCGWQFFTEKPNYCENCGAPILWEGR